MLYFVPKSKALTAELRKEHGLDRLLDSCQHRETMNGPDGGGILVGESSHSADYMHYEPAKQTWSKRFGLSSWVGTWNDRPVSPASLARSPLLDGNLVTLLDNQQWQIPLLRKWHETDAAFEFGNQMPRVMQRSQTTGRFVLGAVIPKYRELWDLSLKIADSMFAQLAQTESATLDESEVEEFVCAVLAANYRVDADVISHLQLLTAELSGAIVRAALDWDTLRAHLKNRLSRQLSGGMSS
jgi:hypothetical protein